MKRLAVFLALLIAVATTGGTGTQYSGIETMTFQNGVYPTAGYTGCEATYIVSRGAANANYGGCDTLNLQAPTGTYGGPSNILIKFDIGDLPDGAIITAAKLWLYQIGPAGTSITPSESDAVYAYRMVSRWREGAGACGGTQNGFADWDSSGYGQWNGGVGTGSTGVNAFTSLHWSPVNAGFTTSDSTTLATRFSGADTLSGEPTNSTGVDRPAEPETISIWRNGPTAARRLGWVTLDLLEATKLWHIGAINNNGTLLKTGADGIATATIAFASDEYTWKHRRPKLVVSYIDTTGLGGSGGGGPIVQFGGR